MLSLVLGVFMSNDRRRLIDLFYTLTELTWILDLQSSHKKGFRYLRETELKNNVGEAHCLCGVSVPGPGW